MTTLRPSAAPRWKIATRIFLRAPGASAAYSARSSHNGAEPAPTMASAELRRKKRRLVISMFLKLRGTQGDVSRQSSIHYHAGYAILGHLQGEIHARQQPARVDPLLA